MSDIKVSIIMPVYKVEEYVGKAIESIQAQTLTEWEFIIVDDGTPDKSGEICDAYAEKDNRIKVIHKENGGAPSARNVAIDIAKGIIYDLRILLFISVLCIKPVIDDHILHCVAYCLEKLLLSCLFKLSAIKKLNVVFYTFLEGFFVKLFVNHFDPPVVC